MTQSGIYKITCLVNGKFYVGSSINIPTRFKDHRYTLSNKTHRNKYLQRSWDKYGEDKFAFSIIEECDIENLLEREQYWLDTLRAYDRDIGFNLAVEAKNPLSYYGKEYIIQYPDGHEELIKNLNKFARNHSLSESCLRACSNGRSIQHKGYKCRKPEQEAPQDKKDPIFWIVITPDGEELSLTNLNKFCKNRGLSTSHLCAVANGKFRHHKHYVCYRRGVKPTQRIKKVFFWKITHPDGKVEIVKNLRQFARDKKLNRTILATTATGRIDNLNGYRCEKVDQALANKEASGIMNYEENETKTS